MIRTLTAAALLAASTAVLSQAPSAPAEGAPGPQGKPRAHARFDCSKAKDPKACEERREKVRAARDKALKACEGTQGTQRRDCMVKQACAEAKDPAQCEARIKERAEKRRQHRERSPEQKSDKR
jgi:Spy/CpxP family protein refolding chaperone